MEAVAVWGAVAFSVFVAVTALIMALAGRSSQRQLLADIGALRDAWETSVRADPVVPATKIEPEISPEPVKQVKPEISVESAEPVEPKPVEFLITDAGQGVTTPADDLDYESRTRIVLNRKLGEPLVKAASFGYGLRLALTPENRNRIRFEMKRELRRTRKARKAAVRRAAAEARKRKVPR